MRGIECLSCPIISYEISRQMIEAIKSGDIFVYHKEQLKFLTGKDLDHYPKLPIDRLCGECTIDKNNGVIYDKK